MRWSFQMADLVYHAGWNVRLCWRGRSLANRHSTADRGIQVRRYWTNKRKTCPPPSNRSTGTARWISWLEHQRLVDDSLDPDGKTLRRCRAGHPFEKTKARKGDADFP
jgi:hypothetical protein